VDGVDHRTDDVSGIAGDPVQQRLKPTFLMKLSIRKNSVANFLPSLPQILKYQTSTKCIKHLQEKIIIFINF